jgi:uncharacterized protein (TIGR03435 family)
MKAHELRTVLSASLTGVLWFTLSMAFGQPETRPAFEVASVKRNASHARSDFAPRRSGTLVMMHNTQVGSFIFYAYHLEGSYELVGLPDWPDESRWFDIDARTAVPDAPDDRVRLMFQSLLADRFKLRMHRETREMPEYVLTLGKGKLKLTPSTSKNSLNITIEDRPYTQAPETCGTSLWREGTHVVCCAATMDKITAQIRGALRSPVADRTGLTGTYDLNLLFMPEGRPPEPDDQILAPTLTGALSDVGLKLENGKGPVEVLVIDHIERPSDN